MGELEERERGGGGGESGQEGERGDGGGKKRCRETHIHRHGLIKQSS